MNSFAAQPPTLGWINEFPYEAGQTYVRFTSSSSGLDDAGNVHFLGGFTTVDNAYGLMRSFDSSGLELQQAKLNIHSNPRYVSGVPSTEDGVQSQDSRLGPNGETFWIGSTSAAYESAQLAKVRKFSPTGTLEWERSLGAGKGQWHYVTSDSAGSIYLLGDTYGDLGGPNAGGTDSILQKFSTNGTLEWTRQFGGAGDDSPSHIDVDGSNNVLIAGTFPTGPQSRNSFITKHDSLGNFLWQRQLGSTSASIYPRGIAGDGDGNVFLASTENLVQQPSGSHLYDSIIRKFDLNGSEIWSRTVSSLRTDHQYSFEIGDLTTDAAGNLYVATSSRKALGDFKDGKILKYDPAGELLWTFDFLNRSALSLSVDDAGRIAVVGSTTFGSGDPTSIYFDSWVGLLHQRAVPEPSGLSAAFIAMTGAVFFRRRKPQRLLTTNTQSSGGRRQGRLFERLEERTVLSATFGSAVAYEYTPLDVATDSAGNTVMTGGFTGAVDFDPTSAHVGNTDVLTAGGSADGFFAKYGADGSLLWVNQLRGAGSSSGVGRTLTSDLVGNTYVAGDFSGTVTIGAFTLTSSSARDAFVAKLDPSGNVLWASRWNGVGTEYVYGIAVDTSGNVVTTGSTTKYNANGSLAYTNLQVNKFSNSGASLWGKQIGATSGATQGSGIDTDSSGNVYIAGDFNGKVDFDPSSKSYLVNGGANDNAFVLKLTIAGNFSWVTPFTNQTTASYSGAGDVVVDAANNVIVGGHYYGSVDFDPGNAKVLLPAFSVSSGSYTSPGFLAKLGSGNGSLQWVRRVGSGVDSIALDAAGDIYASGVFALQVDFDPGTGVNLLTSKGGTDVFATKFSSNGNYQWAVAVGGVGSDRSNGIAVDLEGNVSLAGLFRGSVDFDPDQLSDHLLTSNGDSDGFLLKLRQIAP